MLKIDAGTLDSRVTLLEPTRTLDSTGHHTVTYTEKATLWANIKQITLREAINSNVELQTETYTVMMRYLSGITNEWRMVLPNGCRYRLMSINADKRADCMIIGIELDNQIVQRVES